MAEEKQGEYLKSPSSCLYRRPNRYTSVGKGHAGNAELFMKHYLIDVVCHWIRYPWNIWLQQRAAFVPLLEHFKDWRCQVTGEAMLSCPDQEISAGHKIFLVPWVVPQELFVRHTCPRVCSSSGSTAILLCRTFLDIFLNIHSRRPFERAPCSFCMPEWMRVALLPLMFLRSVSMRHALCGDRYCFANLAGKRGCAAKDRLLRR